MGGGFVYGFRELSESRGWKVENVSMSGPDFDTHKLKGLVGNLAVIMKNMV